MVGTAKNCLDLGAGTGNGTLKLLSADAERKVWAVETNEAMLQQLRNKLAESVDDSISQRVEIVKQDISHLNEFIDGAFDAAIMINVFYVLDDPARCTEEIARVLKPGGVFVLSTAHKETDVEYVFKAIKNDLKNKGIFDEHQKALASVRDRNTAMLEHIHRDRKEDIRRYLEEAGFFIEEWRDEEYAKAVVLVKAVKPD